MPKTIKKPMTKRGPAKKRLGVTARTESDERETFAILVAGGLNQQEASLEIRPHLSPRAAKNLGWQWGKLMQKRIIELRESAARVADLMHGVNRLSLVAWHKSVLDTPVGELHENHPLAQEMTITETTRMTDEGPVQTRRVKIKMPAKTDSARELAKILGYYAQPQIDSNLDDYPATGNDNENEPRDTLAEFMRKYVRPGMPIDHRREDIKAGRIKDDRVKINLPELLPPESELETADDT